MKKLIAMAALCMAGMVFAQEPEVVPAPEAAPVEPPKCECGASKPCVCQQPCRCDGEEKKGERCGEFRRHGRHGRPGMRGHHGEKGPGMHPPMPKFKKCECCPECKGVIILPPNANEGEPLFKLFDGECRGPRPECRGPRPECRGPKCACPDGAKPEQPGCPCEKGPACDCPKGE